MKKISSLILLFAGAGLLFGTILQAQVSPRSRESFNEDWKFIRYFNASNEAAASDKEPKGLEAPEFNDSGWRDVELPHDWAIEGPFNDTLENNTGLLPWKGIGWYRKHFTINESDRDKKIFVDFDGAMANAKIWLNGNYVGEWPYGYTSFRMDLTPYISYGKENIIAVRLDTKNWDSRWYPGAGLYRNVWLVKTSKLHIVYNGLFCTTPEIRKERAVLSVDAEILNDLKEVIPVTIKASVRKLNRNNSFPDGDVAGSGMVMGEIPVASMRHFRMDITVREPVRWDIENPELYAVKVSVYRGDDLMDEYDTDIGFRTLDFTPRDGFLLNGKRVEIRGVCNHHDLGALGAAINTRAIERQLEILKEMGCNAIRTSHNPPAPELLDLCDRMGFLVEDEAFDAWRKGKKKNDYNKLFETWHAEDLRALVRRDRNHPSVILWSIGNEVPDQDNPALSTALHNIVKSEDNTRPVTAGCDRDYSGTNGFQKTLDVFGINYRLYRYDAFFELSENANLPFHSSESASTISSRGEYFFPVKEGDPGSDPQGKSTFQITSYDLAHPAWATTPDQQWALMDRIPAVFGEFVWTGFDYLGEPTPFSEDLSGLSAGSKRYETMKVRLDKMGVAEIPSRSSYFGILDLAGFKKDRFYLYQSRWRPELPMAHILPHWNWPERKGQVIPVHVYTSGDEAELFLNGKSLGKKKKGQYEYRLRWDDVVYQPGELKVVAYKNGKEWAEDVMKTTGKPSQISLSADRPEIKADGKDLVFITARIEDKNQLMVPGSSNKLNFIIKGPGMIVATDNGDAASHESFQSPAKQAFNGMCLVIIAANKNATGEITVEARSGGLKSGSVTINLYQTK